MPGILLVEPDKQLAETIKKYLIKQGLEVSIGPDAQEGLTLADEDKPDLVVLEIAISKHNGVAFLQELRSYEDWRNLPVIIYSQIAREDTGVAEADWQKLGVAVYLYKPTSTLASLFNNIQEVLTNYEKS
jgi:two-component system, OmpR family, response regulator BaeR